MNRRRAKAVLAVAFSMFILVDALSEGHAREARHGHGIVLQGINWALTHAVMVGLPLALFAIVMIAVLRSSIESLAGERLFPVGAGMLLAATAGSQFASSTLLPLVGGDMPLGYLLGAVFCGARASLLGSSDGLGWRPAVFVVVGLSAGLAIETIHRAFTLAQS